MLVSRVTMYDELVRDFHGTLDFLTKCAAPYYDQRSNTWFVAKYSTVRELLLDRRLTSGRSGCAFTGVPRADVKYLRPLDNHFRRWLAFSESPPDAVIRKLIRRALTVPPSTQMAGIHWETQGTATNKTGNVGHLNQSRPIAQIAASVTPSRLLGTDLAADFIDPLVDAAVLATLGLPLKHETLSLTRHGRVLLRYLSQSHYNASTVANATSALDSITQYFWGQYLEEAKGAVPDALRDLSLYGVEPGKLVAVFAQLLTGGLEPIKTVVGEAVARLYENGNYPVFRESPSSFISEIVRLATPFHFAPHTSRTSIRLDGLTIPAGARVMLVLAAANRDASAFPEPDALVIGRPGPRHLAFGHGRHTCLGIGMAQEVVRSAIEAVISHKDWGLATRANQSVVHASGMTRLRSLIIQ